MSERKRGRGGERGKGRDGQEEGEGGIITKSPLEGCFLKSIDNLWGIRAWNFLLSFICSL